MRIFLLADNLVGAQVASYLREEGEDIVGLALHPESIRKYGCEIISAAGVPEERAILAKELSDSAVVERVRKLDPEIMLSVFWGYILKPDVFSIPPAGCINFHCSYLPYNRGKNPNVWPIIEGTPAGITLHYIDEGIDTGRVIARRRIDVSPIDTAQTIYERQITEFLPLFRETWPLIRAGKHTSLEQDETLATFHLAKQFGSLDEIDLEKSYRAGDLINLLRARSFPPHPAAYFVSEDGRKIYVRVSLEYADDPS